MVTNLGRKLLRVQICFLVSLFPLLASLTCAQVRKELLGLSQHLAVNQQTLSFCTESKYTISPPPPLLCKPPCLCPGEEGAAGVEPACLHKAQLAVRVQVGDRLLEEIHRGLKVRIKDRSIPAGGKDKEEGLTRRSLLVHSIFQGMKGAVALNAQTSKALVQGANALCGLRHQASPPSTTRARPRYTGRIGLTQSLAPPAARAPPPLLRPCSPGGCRAAAPARWAVRACRGSSCECWGDKV